MGSLSGYQIPRTDVKVSGGQAITVRGLSVNDLVEILRDHSSVLDRLYQTHIVNSNDVPPAAHLARTLMTEAPTVVSKIIALANDEPECWEIVGQMPGLDQINCLVEVGLLTFHSEAEVKKLMETLIQGSGVLSSLLGVVGNRSLPEA